MLANTTYVAQVKELIEFLDINMAEATTMVDAGITVESLKEQYGDLPGNWIKGLL